VDSILPVEPSAVPILAFHKVDRRFEWGVTRVSPAGFRKVLAFLKNGGYRTVSLRSLCDPQFQPPEKPVVLTFDDSYASLYDNALPLLREFGFTAAVFVVTGYAGRLNRWDVNLGWIRFRHLDWSQIEELRRDGIEIESHTVNHPDLTRMDGASLRLELADSKKAIEDRLGAPVRFLSFPFGRYNRRVLDAMRECGYDRGVGYWIDDPSDKTLVFKRRAYYLFDGLWNLRAKLGSGAWTAFEDVKLRSINFFSHGTALVKPHRR
jgi:peptidoglycan/xylan/chitin deacetylase (PgdA/CDA1 family)